MTDLTSSKRCARAPVAAGALLAMLTAALGCVACSRASDSNVESPPPATAHAPSAGLRRVTVDASKTSGRLRSLQGANGAPAPGFHKPIRFQFGGWNGPEETDATPGYHAARIDLI